MTMPNIKKKYIFQELTFLENHFSKENYFSAKKENLVVTKS
jgi:hypothetical protein